MRNRLNKYKYPFEIHVPVKFDDLLCEAYVPRLKTVFIYDDPKIPRLR
jgi:hypothetical protein